MIKQGALQGEGEEHLGALLRGLCGVQLLLAEEGAGEGGGGGGGGRGRRRKRRRVCEWTDLTLPMLTAILAQRPKLSDETVLCLLERMQGALEVG